MIPNTKAQGTLNPLSQELERNTHLIQELNEFKEEYTKNPRNVFIYTPGRVNSPLIGAVLGDVNDGVYVPITPDQFQLSQALTPLTDRRLANLTGFTISITCAFQIRNGFFTDTSTSDIQTPIRILIGTVPYSTNGLWNPGTTATQDLFYPIFQANLGDLIWNKSEQSFAFNLFNNTFDLLDTTVERDQGTIYRDFTFGEGQITQSDLDLLLNSGQMLTIALTVEPQSPLANTDFITNQDITLGYPGLAFRLSYAFNYYANLANF